MKFFSTVVVATLVASAAALPGGYGGGHGGPPGGNGNGNGGNGGNGNGNGGIITGGGTNAGGCVGSQTVNCCNTGNSKQSQGGLLGFFSIILQPGQCSPLIGGFFSSGCGNNVAQCCNNAQGGLININIGQCVAFPFL